MMESVERLRKDADICTQMAGIENKFETVWITKNALLKDIDAIEREMEEGYIELPKDMNGECIRIGDTLETADDPRACMKVRYIAYDGECYAVEDEYTEPPTFFPNFLDMCHHKPPTVEGVLEDALNKAANLDRMEGYWPSAADIANIVSEVAPKLQLREAE